jgi:hypothetical protein
LSEGIVIAFLFWGILYVTVESSSLGGAVRAGLISESIGNLPYLFGEAGLGPVGLIMSLVEAEIFIRIRCTDYLLCPGGGWLPARPSRILDQRLRQRRPAQRLGQFVNPSIFA